MQTPREKKPKEQVPRPGTERGDHVYVEHPERGAISVRVLSTGKDGITGECDQKQRHQVLWDHVVGHKSRMLNAYRVAEQGGDGMILEGPDGRRRYLAADTQGSEDPPAEPGIPKPHGRETKDDPLLAGETKLRKALTMADDLPILFLKGMGTPLKNRAGLHLEGRTDKGGHQTKRWVKGDQGAGAPEKPAAASIKHGDRIRFRHGDVEGEGKVFASGADGVMVKDGEGRNHQVRHEHIVHPEHGTTAAQRDDEDAPDAAAGGGGRGAPPGSTGGGNGEGSDDGGGGGGDDRGDPPPLFQGDDMSLPTKCSQPVSEPEQVFKLSDEAHEQLKTWLDDGKGICDRLGFKTVAKPKEMTGDGGYLILPSELKGMDRSKQKVADEYDGDWSKLIDVARCSIAVDRYDELPGLVAALQKGGMKLARKPKDRFHEPNSVGYRDVLLNVTMPNGGVVEVQLHVKAMLEAKKAGHAHYDVSRELEPKIQAADAAGETVPDDVRKTYDDAIAAQRKIYSEAWQTATGGSNIKSGDLRKALEMSEAGYSYFDHDNAYYRRKDGGVARGINDVLGHDGQWKPYTGQDALAPALYGDKIDDPTADAVEGGDQKGDAQPAREPEMAMAKSLLGRARDKLRILFPVAPTA